MDADPIVARDVPARFWVQPRSVFARYGRAGAVAEDELSGGGVHAVEHDAE